MPRINAIVPVVHNSQRHRWRRVQASMTGFPMAFRRWGDWEGRVEHGPDSTGR